MCRIPLNQLKIVLGVALSSAAHFDCGNAIQGEVGASDNIPWTRGCYTCDSLPESWGKSGRPLGVLELATVSKQ